MLRIRKEQLNKIAVTLQEKTTVDIYYPLFNFVDEKRQEINNLVHLNAIISNSRYDEFEITLPGDIDLNAGQYNYFVYQSLTPGDLEFENMVLLERGKAFII